MKKLVTICIALLVALMQHHVASASEIEVKNILLTYERSVNVFPEVTFTVGWKNGWYNQTNHDAAWIIVKLVMPDGRLFHGRVHKTGHEVIVDHYQRNNLLIRASKDQTGIFIEPKTIVRGDVSCKVKVLLDTALLRVSGINLRNTRAIVQAIEMVYIPAGAFFIGDTSALARSYASFFQIKDKGRDVYPVKHESDELTVGTAAGNLYYQSQDKTTQGDQQGVVPAAFPKGVHAFYLMKYELTQRQYADFLNTLDSSSAASHDPTQAAAYYANRGAVKKAGRRYVVDDDTRSCNYISWDDAMAYADWSALRPYTELEFTKAARGPFKMPSLDYPWGTTSKYEISRYVDSDGSWRYDHPMDEGQLSDKNKAFFGVSFYWVFDLAGGVWERVITIGDATGRNFKGSHGDGILVDGFADNVDWPQGADQAGFGFRGGGFYSPQRSYNIINPYSPVELRAYGSWAGSKREMAYGSRFARTAD